MLNNRENHELKKETIFKYVYLENRIQNIIQPISEIFCSGCMKCCCKIEICNEVRISAWLRLIKRLNPTPLNRSNEGFLSKEGCTLKYSRPPICYEFFCDEYRNKVKSERLNSLPKVATLLKEVGLRAKGSHHLISLTTLKELRGVNYVKLNNNIEKGISYLNNLR